jgi:hypothetical protein
MMTLYRPLAALIIGDFVSLAQSASIQATLDNGVIHYTAADGQRKAINVGTKCADLWVAPDESVIAFVAIECDWVLILPPLTPALHYRELDINRAEVRRLCAGAR